MSLASEALAEFGASHETTGEGDPFREHIYHLLLDRGCTRNEKGHVVMFRFPDGSTLTATTTYGDTPVTTLHAA